MDEQQVIDIVQRFFDTMMSKKSATDLPTISTVEGFNAIGVDATKRSVQVPMELLKGASGDPLTVRKTYQTEALALADKNPIDTTTSLPLTVGQFVSIVDDGEKNGIYRISFISGDGTMSLELQGKLGDLSDYANHGYESNPKTLKEVDDEKVDHGYASIEVAKTLKQVDDDLVQLAGDLSEEVDVIKKITDSSFRIENKVLNGNYIVLNSYTTILPNKVDLIKNHKYYTIRKVELADGATQGSVTGRVAHLGTGFRLINLLNTDGKSGNIETFIDETVLDASITVYGSGSGDVYFSNFMIIDLTKAFGEGNEPTVEEMDALVDMVDGGYFENILPNKYTLKWVQNELELKIEDVDDDLAQLAGELGSEIDWLSAFSNNRASIFSKNERYTKGTGELVNGGSYNTTDFIDIDFLKGFSISYNFSTSATVNAISVFSEGKDYIGNIQEVSFFKFDSVLELYPNAKYVRLSCTHGNFNSFKIHQSNVELKKDIDKINAASKVSPPLLVAKIFRRVGCIGDSYTGGYIKITSETLPNNTHPLWSWVHYMKNLTGETWDNWGKGGSTSKGWVEGAANLHLVTAEGNKCQAYVIGLMINDLNSGMPYYTPVGVISDIGTDNDTYYAYYYKLIKECVGVNADAKIFCNTCPKSGSNYENYNQAVRDIVEYCYNTEGLNVYLCDLASEKYMTEEYYGNPVFEDDLIYGHYSPIGYEFMAECYLKVVSNVIMENLKDFQNVFLIPYDEA